MKYRTVVMYVEIGCFVSCLCGWILVCSTLPTEYWTFSEVGSIVLTTSNYYSNLWRDCISDTTGVSDCKDYPSMLALPGKDARETAKYQHQSSFLCMKIIPNTNRNGVLRKDVRPCSMSPALFQGSYTPAGRSPSAPSSAGSSEASSSSSA